MSLMGKILEFIGFESVEKEVKRKPKKEKSVKASYSLKKKSIEKVDNIDGIPVVYLEILEDARRCIDRIKDKEAFIFSIEECQEKEKVVSYLMGLAEFEKGKIQLLEKEKYYIYLPEDVELEREN